MGSKILDVYIALARFLGSFWAGAFYPSYLFAFQLFVLFVNFKGNFYSFHFHYSSFGFCFLNISLNSAVNFSALALSCFSVSGWFDFFPSRIQVGRILFSS